MRTYTGQPWRGDAGISAGGGGGHNASEGGPEAPDEVRIASVGLGLQCGGFGHPPSISEVTEAARRHRGLYDGRQSISVTRPSGIVTREGRAGSGPQMV